MAAVMVKTRTGLDIGYISIILIVVILYFPFLLLFYGITIITPYFQHHMTIVVKVRRNKFDQ